ncbi:hypothetical protein BaRGS_00022039, partial [Batillaria attramentaria]
NTALDGIILQTDVAHRDHDEIRQAEESRREPVTEVETERETVQRTTAQEVKDVEYDSEECEESTIVEHSMEEDSKYFTNTVCDVALQTDISQELKHPKPKDSRGKKWACLSCVQRKESDEGQGPSIVNKTSTKLSVHEQDMVQPANKPAQDAVQRASRADSAQDTVQQSKVTEFSQDGTRQADELVSEPSTEAEFKGETAQAAKDVKPEQENIEITVAEGGADETFEHARNTEFEVAKQTDKSPKSTLPKSKDTLGRKWTCLNCIQRKESDERQGPDLVNKANTKESEHEQDIVLPTCQEHGLDGIILQTDVAHRDHDEIRQAEESRREPVTEVETERETVQRTTAQEVKDVEYDSEECEESTIVEHSMEEDSKYFTNTVCDVALQTDISQELKHPKPKDSRGKKWACLSCVQRKESDEGQGPSIVNKKSTKLSVHEQDMVQPANKPAQDAVQRASRADSAQDTVQQSKVTEFSQDGTRQADELVSEPSTEAEFKGETAQAAKDVKPEQENIEITVAEGGADETFEHARNTEFEVAKQTDKSPKSTLPKSKDTLGRKWTCLNCIQRKESDERQGPDLVNKANTKESEHEQDIVLPTCQEHGLDGIILQTDVAHRGHDEIRQAEESRREPVTEVETERETVQRTTAQEVKDVEYDSEECEESTIVEHSMEEDSKYFTNTVCDVALQTDISQELKHPKPKDSRGKKWACLSCVQRKESDEGQGPSIVNKTSTKQSVHEQDMVQPANKPAQDAVQRASRSDSAQDIVQQSKVTEFSQDGTRLANELVSEPSTEAEFKGETAQAAKDVKPEQENIEITVAEDGADETFEHARNTEFEVAKQTDKFPKSTLPKSRDTGGRKWTCLNCIQRKESDERQGPDLVNKANTKESEHEQDIVQPICQEHGLDEIILQADVTDRDHDEIRHAAESGREPVTEVETERETVQRTTAEEVKDAEYDSEESEESTIVEHSMEEDSKYFTNTVCDVALQTDISQELKHPKPKDSRVRKWACLSCMQRKESDEGQCPNIVNKTSTKRSEHEQDMVQPANKPDYLEDTIQLAVVKHHNQDDPRDMEQEEENVEEAMIAESDHIMQEDGKRTRELELYLNTAFEVAKQTESQNENKRTQEAKSVEHEQEKGEDAVVAEQSKEVSFEHARNTAFEVTKSQELTSGKFKDSRRKCSCLNCLQRKESDHGQGPDMVNETSTTESGHEQDTEQPASTADSQEEMNQQAKLTPKYDFQRVVESPHQQEPIYLVADAQSEQGELLQYKETESSQGTSEQSKEICDYKHHEEAHGTPDWQQPRASRTGDQKSRQKKPLACLNCIEQKGSDDSVRHPEDLKHATIHETVCKQSKKTETQKDITEQVKKKESAQEKNHQPAISEHERAGVAMSANGKTQQVSMFKQNGIQQPEETQIAQGKATEPPGEQKGIANNVDSPLPTGDAVTRQSLKPLTKSKGSMKWSCLNCVQTKESSHDVEHFNTLNRPKTENKLHVEDRAKEVEVVEYDQDKSRKGIETSGDQEKIKIFEKTREAKTETKMIQGGEQPHTSHQITQSDQEIARYTTDMFSGPEKTKQAKSPECPGRSQRSAETIVEHSKPQHLEDSGFEQDKTQQVKELDSVLCKKSLPARVNKRPQAKGTDYELNEDTDFVEQDNIGQTMELQGDIVSNKRSDKDKTMGTEDTRSRQDTYMHAVHACKTEIKPELFHKAVQTDPEHEQKQNRQSKGSPGQKPEGKQSRESRSGDQKARQKKPLACLNCAKDVAHEQGEIEDSPVADAKHITQEGPARDLKLFRKTATLATVAKRIESQEEVQQVKTSQIERDKIHDAKDVCEQIMEKENPIRPQQTKQTRSDHSKEMWPKPTTSMGEVGTKMKHDAQMAMEHQHQQRPAEARSVQGVLEQDKDTDFDLGTCEHNQDTCDCKQNRNARVTAEEKESQEIQTSGQRAGQKKPRTCLCCFRKRESDEGVHHPDGLKQAAANKTECKPERAEQADTAETQRDTIRGVKKTESVQENKKHPVTLEHELAVFEVPDEGKTPQESKLQTTQTMYLGGVKTHRGSETEDQHSKPPQTERAGPYQTKKGSDEGQPYGLVSKASTNESGHEQDIDEPASKTKYQQEMTQQAELTELYQDETRQDTDPSRETESGHKPPQKATDVEREQEQESVQRVAKTKPDQEKLREGKEPEFDHGTPESNQEMHGCKHDGKVHESTEENKLPDIRTSSQKNKQSWACLSCVKKRESHEGVHHLDDLKEATIKRETNRTQTDNARSDTTEHVTETDAEQGLYQQPVVPDVKPAIIEASDQEKTKQASTNEQDTIPQHDESSRDQARTKTTEQSEIEEVDPEHNQRRFLQPRDSPCKTWACLSCIQRRESGGQIVGLTSKASGRESSHVEESGYVPVTETEPASAQKAIEYAKGTDIAVVKERAYEVATQTDSEAGQVQYVKRRVSEQDTVQKTKEAGSEGATGADVADAKVQMVRKTTLTMESQPQQEPVQTVMQSQSDQDDVQQYAETEYSQGALEQDEEMCGHRKSHETTQGIESPETRTRCQRDRQKPWACLSCIRKRESGGSVHGPDELKQATTKETECEQDRVKQVAKTATQEDTIKQIKETESVQEKKQRSAPSELDPARVGVYVEEKDRTQGKPEHVTTNGTELQRGVNSTEYDQEVPDLNFFKNAHGTTAGIKSLGSRTCDHERELIHQGVQTDRVQNQNPPQGVMPRKVWLNLCCVQRKGSNDGMQNTEANNRETVSEQKEAKETMKIGSQENIIQQQKYIASDNNQSRRAVSEEGRIQGMETSYDQENVSQVKPTEFVQYMVSQSSETNKKDKTLQPNDKNDVESKTQPDNTSASKKFLFGMGAQHDQEKIQGTKEACKHPRKMCDSDQHRQIHGTASEHRKHTLTKVRQSQKRPIPHERETDGRQSGVSNTGGITVGLTIPDIQRRDPSSSEEQCEMPKSIVNSQIERGVNLEIRKSKEYTPEMVYPEDEATESATDMSTPDEGTVKGTSETSTDSGTIIGTTTDMDTFDSSTGLTTDTEIGAYDTDTKLDMLERFMSCKDTGMDKTLRGRRGFRYHSAREDKVSQVCKTCRHIPGASKAYRDVSRKAEGSDIFEKTKHYYASICSHGFNDRHDAHYYIPENSRVHHDSAQMANGYHHGPRNYKGCHGTLSKDTDCHMTSEKGKGRETLASRRGRGFPDTPGQRKRHRSVSEEGTVHRRIPRMSKNRPETETSTCSSRNKEELASRLEKAQEKASLLETQLAETCHTKYKQHKEMADKLQAQMDDIKKKMEDRDEEIQDMSEQLNKLRRLAAARKKQIKQIKAREADTEAEREKEKEMCAKLEKEKREAELKLYSETLRYQRLITDIDGHKQQLLTVRTKMESLDHTRVRRELEFQYRADLGQVIRNLARFLDKSQAALEQAELTKNEMDFRQRVDAGNARKYMSRQQHLAALEEASKMETLLLRDIYRETGPASVTRRPPALRSDDLWLPRAPGVLQDQNTQPSWIRDCPKSVNSGFTGGAVARASTQAYGNSERFTSTRAVPARPQITAPQQDLDRVAAYICDNCTAGLESPSPRAHAATPAVPLPEGNFGPRGVDIPRDFFGGLRTANPREYAATQAVPLPEGDFGPRAVHTPTDLSCGLRTANPWEYAAVLRSPQFQEYFAHNAANVRFDIPRSVQPSAPTDRVEDQSRGRSEPVPRPACPSYPSEGYDASRSSSPKKVPSPPGKPQVHPPGLDSQRTYPNAVEDQSRGRSEPVPRPACACYPSEGYDASRPSSPTKTPSPPGKPQVHPPGLDSQRTCPNAGRDHATQPNDQSGGCPPHQTKCTGTIECFADSGYGSSPPAPAGSPSPPSKPQVYTSGLPSTNACGELPVQSYRVDAQAGNSPVPQKAVPDTFSPESGYGSGPSAPVRGPPPVPPKRLKSGLNSQQAYTDASKGMQQRQTPQDVVPTAPHPDNTPSLPVDLLVKDSDVDVLSTPTLSFLDMSTPEPSYPEIRSAAQQASSAPVTVTGAGHVIAPVSQQQHYSDQNTAAKLSQRQYSQQGQILSESYLEIEMVPDNAEQKPIVVRVHSNTELFSDEKTMPEFTIESTWSGVIDTRTGVVRTDPERHVTETRPLPDASRSETRETRYGNARGNTADAARYQRAYSPESQAPQCQVTSPSERGQQPGVNQFPANSGVSLPARTPARTAPPSSGPTRQMRASPRAVESASKMLQDLCRKVSPTSLTQGPSPARQAWHEPDVNRYAKYPAVWDPSVPSPTPDRVGVTPDTTPTPSPRTCTPNSTPSSSPTRQMWYEQDVSRYTGSPEGPLPVPSPTPAPGEVGVYVTPTPPAHTCTPTATPSPSPTRQAWYDPDYNRYLGSPGGLDPSSTTQIPPASICSSSSCQLGYEWDASQFPRDQGGWIPASTPPVPSPRLSATHTQPASPSYQQAHHAHPDLRPCQMGTVGCQSPSHTTADLDQPTRRRRHVTPGAEPGASTGPAGSTFSGKIPQRPARATPSTILETLYENFFGARRTQSNIWGTSVSPEESQETNPRPDLLPRAAASEMWQRQSDARQAAQDVLQGVPQSQSSSPSRQSSGGWKDPFNMPVIPASRRASWEDPFELYPLSRQNSGQKGAGDPFIL